MIVDNGGRPKNIQPPEQQPRAPTAQMLRRHEYNRAHTHTYKRPTKQNNTHKQPINANRAHTATGRLAIIRWSKPTRRLGVARTPNRPANPAVKLLLLLRRQAVVGLCSLP